MTTESEKLDSAEKIKTEQNNVDKEKAHRIHSGRKTEKSSFWLDGRLAICQDQPNTDNFLQMIALPGMRSRSRLMDRVRTVLIGLPVMAALITSQFTHGQREGEEQESSELVASTTQEPDNGEISQIRTSASWPAGFVFASGFVAAGSLALIILVLLQRKKLREGRALVENLKNGVEPVRLLDEEALQTWRTLDKSINEARDKIEKQLKDERDQSKKQNDEHKNQLLKLHDEFKEHCTSHNKGLQTTKEQLTDALKKMVSYVNSINENVDKIASENLEFQKDANAQLKQKDEELKGWRSQGHLHFLKGSINPILSSRDILMDINEHHSEIPDQVVSQLKSIEENIEECLAILGVEELEISPEQDIEKDCLPRFWKDIGAGEPTTDESKHKKVARVSKRGYRLRLKQDTDDWFVIRQSTVVRFCYKEDGRSEEIESQTAEEVPDPTEDRSTVGGDVTKPEDSPVLEADPQPQNPNLETPEKS